MTDIVFRKTTTTTTTDAKSRCFYLDVLRDAALGDAEARPLRVGVGDHLEVVGSENILAEERGVLVHFLEAHAL